MSAATLNPEAWIPLPAPASADLSLLCFPHAGAGVAAYHEWRALLPTRFAAVPIRLPGRETRLGEPAFDRVEPLVQLLCEALRPGLDAPYALCGHSMGALVAFELARAIRRAGLPGPAGLVVSGRPAPQLPAAGPSIHNLSDDEFTTALTELGGLPDAVVENRELLMLFLPLLRADLALNEAYDYRLEAPLDVPITALAGADDPRVRPHDVAAWSEQTGAAFRFEVVPGRHFFAFDRAPQVVALVAEELTRWAPR
jgi:medium-chain acyl-[acyl-carrier-protein] hydrolase